MYLCALHWTAKNVTLFLKWQPCLLFSLCASPAYMVRCRALIFGTAVHLYKCYTNRRNNGTVNTVNIAEVMNFLVLYFLDSHTHCTFIFGYIHMPNLFFTYAKLAQVNMDLFSKHHPPCLSKNGNVTETPLTEGSWYIFFSNFIQISVVARKVNKARWSK